MIVRICAFTKNGWGLAAKIEDIFPEHIFEKKNTEDSIYEWVEKGFSINSPIIFIGAIGIAVRSIAPFVKDKMYDSPVIVIDEEGRFVIPILSSHIGGAGRIAEELSERLLAQAVITTATDIHGLFSVDTFAVKNGLEIINRDGIREVSAKLLEEGSVTMAISPEIEFRPEDIPEEIKLVKYIKNLKSGSSIDIIISFDEADKSRAKLLLRPEEYILGIGCKKNASEKMIRNAVYQMLGKNKLKMNQVVAIASLDIKSTEYGLVLFAQIEKKELITFSADELNAVDGEDSGIVFSESEFVRKVTGVSNVCERAAFCLAGDSAELVVPKNSGEGVTTAIARRKIRLRFW